LKHNISFFDALRAIAELREFIGDEAFDLLRKTRIVRSRVKT
jgi:hypothetical protein